jgi:membrane-associated phospholipid phosphatase
MSRWCAFREWACDGHGGLRGGIGVGGGHDRVYPVWNGTGAAGACVDGEYFGDSGSEFVSGHYMASFAVRAALASATWRRASRSMRLGLGSGS